MVQRLRLAHPGPVGFDGQSTAGTWTLSVSDGAGGDTGVVVTDTLPAEVAYVSDDCGGSNTPPWTWNVGTVNSGATSTCHITTSVVTPGAILNTAVVTATNDTTPNNNVSSATVVGGPPVPVAEVPTLDSVGLGVLLAGLAICALVMLRRRTNA